jgi:hypothetical protein
MKMAAPRQSNDEKEQLTKEFEGMHPRPSLPGWDKLNHYDRKRTHAKQYEKLFQQLKDAADELKEFLNCGLHRKARNPLALRQRLKDIEEYEAALKEWKEQLKSYQWHVHKTKVLQDDRDHVARTGLCCGQGKWAGIRTCKRRATHGNFCYQHEQKAEVFRRF